MLAKQLSKKYQSTNFITIKPPLKMENILPKALKKLRQSHSLNQTQMATKLEISQSYYAEIEKGNKGLTVKKINEFIAKVSTVFNLSANWHNEQIETKTESYNYCPHCGKSLK